MQVFAVRAYTSVMQDEMFMKEWLALRRITDVVVAESGIHWGTQHTLGGCIVIPIHYPDGTFCFNKYRRDPRIDLKPKYIYDKGSKAMLYGAEAIGDAQTVLITEGEMDSLVARSAHIAAVSSTGGANTFLPEWAELLKGREVLVCFDNDNAGAEGMVKVLGLIPDAKIVFVPEQVGVKDISDYAARGGNLHDLMRTARGYTGIEDVQEDKSQRDSVWLSTRFHDAYIEAHTPVVYANARPRTGAVQGKVERAKAHPIHTLLKFNKDHKAPCIWHSEKSPSLHYYAAQNRVHCFGCGKHGDAIDVIRQMRGCTFAEAVDFLI